MCDTFETGRRPLSILVTTNSTYFRQLQRYTRVNLIIFDIVCFSETDKGILLFSKQDRDECHIFLRTMYCQAAQAGNCFHEYVLKACLRVPGLFWEAGGSITPFWQIFLYFKINMKTC